MLDVLLIAHEPNYQRMAHRSLNPNPDTADSTVRGSLPSAVDRLAAANKIVLSLEGGRHQAFEAAEAYLSSQPFPWQIVHSDETSGYRNALLRGLEHCSSSVVAIVPAWCELTDKAWFQRLAWTLSNDQRALLCTTPLEQGPARDLAPFIAKPRTWPGGEIILARRHDLTSLLRLTEPGDIYNTLAVACARAGWRIWAHPGVRFTRHPHDDHNEAGQAPWKQTPQPSAGGSRK